MPHADADQPTTLEFWATLNQDGTLHVPAEIVARLERTRPVRVVLVPDAGGDEDWSTLTADQFLAGYDTADAIYDDPPSR